MRTEWRDGDRVRAVELTSEGAGRYRARVDDAEFSLTVEPLADGRARLITDQGATVIELTVAGNRRFIRLGTLDFVLERALGARRSAAGTHAGSLEAPMPGVVTRVLVAVGDTVKSGQPLLAIEAMKMEHVIRAPRDGRIKRIASRVGEMVGGGVALVEMDE
jgi:acetyl/propionyl-CoA carboxylase alpha subunit